MTVVLTRLTSLDVASTWKCYFTIQRPDTSSKVPGITIIEISHKQNTTKKGDFCVLIHVIHCDFKTEKYRFFCCSCCSCILDLVLKQKNRITTFLFNLVLKQSSQRTNHTRIDILSNFIMYNIRFGNTIIVKCGRTCCIVLQ